MVKIYLNRFNITNGFSKTQAENSKKVKKSKKE